jgi:DNA-binding NarL/FixJ family response regulator
MIRVLVADDHAVLRDGLLLVLGNVSDMSVVALASDGNQAVALTAAHDPDVVLMDLEMPGLDGIEATRRIRAVSSRARVLILTSFSDRERILEALDAGAIGYLLKDAEPEQVIAGIRCAALGESPLTPSIARTVLEERGRAAPPGELTEREREVLSLVAAGLSNKRLARRLGISEKTVKAHLTSVFRRIGVADRTQAAMWATRHGLAEPGQGEGSLERRSEWTPRAF